MAINDYPQSQNSIIDKRVFAFFESRDDAYKAMSDLRARGFTSDQIGMMIGPNIPQEKKNLNQEERKQEDRGFLSKVKEFFGGEEEENEETGYSESTSGMGWDPDQADYYRRGLQRGGALVTVSGTRLEEARSVLEAAGADLRERGFERRQAEETEAIPEQRIQLRGEVLRTHRDRIDRGEVRLRKDVKTENQTVEVPVTREELVIEHVPPGERKPAAGEIGEDKEIRIPLSEEKARVEKQPVVTDEVRVGKREVQRNERVSGDVRHEELKVEKKGDIEIEGEKGDKAA